VPMPTFTAHWPMPPSTSELLAPTTA
jgi:hypothetical protein